MQTQSAVAVSTNISIKITGLYLPQESGVTDTYPLLQTALVDGTTVDEASLTFNTDDAIPGTTFTPGRFLNASFQPQFSVVGGVGFVDVKLYPSNPVPDNGQFHFQVESDFLGCSRVPCDANTVVSFFCGCVDPQELFSAAVKFSRRTYWPLESN